MFCKVIDKYIDALNILFKEKENYEVLKLAKTLKVRGESSTENINKIYSTFYNENFSLHPDILSVKELCKEEWAAYQNEFPN